MARAPCRRQWTEAACNHLIDGGHNHKTVFAHDEDRLAFLGLVQPYRECFGLQLYHYCLMTNQFDLLVQFQEARQLFSPFLHRGSRLRRPTALNGTA
jgi:hypothetical protein